MRAWSATTRSRAASETRTCARTGARSLLLRRLQCLAQLLSTMFSLRPMPPTDVALLGPNAWRALHAVVPCCAASRRSGAKLAASWLVGLRRQPEFTQLDMEMTFTDREGIMALVEALVACIFQEVAPHTACYTSPPPSIMPIPHLHIPSSFTAPMRACRRPGICRVWDALHCNHWQASELACMPQADAVHIGGRRRDLARSCCRPQFLHGWSMHAGSHDEGFMPGYCARALPQVAGVELVQPFARLTYDEAMARYGCDKPDLRYGLEQADVSPALRGSSFRRVPSLP